MPSNPTYMSSRPYVPESLPVFKILTRFAAFLFALWTSPTKAGDDNARAVTYCDWLRDEVDKGFRFRCSLQGTSWDDQIHVLHRRMILHCHVPEKDDVATAPKHGDLKAWNVLVDSTGFTGVIDWDTAKIVPMPAAVQHHPLFIADIPGWRNDDVPDSMTFQDDREALEHEVSQLGVSSTAAAAGKRIPELLSISYERQFFEHSLRNKRINSEYIRFCLVEHAMDKARAIEELARFLHAHSDLQLCPAISKLHTQLSG